MNKIILFTLIVLLSGCSQTLDERKQEVKEREYELIHTTEPGTINYIAESMDITIDKTKIALQIIKENEETLLKCFGEKVYTNIVDDYEKKIDFLEDEKPYYITTLFFGEYHLSEVTFSYNNYSSEIQSMAGQIATASEKCLSEPQTQENKNNNGGLTTNNPAPAPISEQSVQPTADQVFENAAKQADQEYNARWQAIKNDPAKFLSDCKSQDMSAAIELGGEDPDKAAAQAEVNCNIQLTDLKNCMDKPDSDPHDCYDNVFNEGD